MLNNKDLLRIPLDPLDDENLLKIELDLPNVNLHKEVSDAHENITVHFYFFTTKRP